MKNFIKIIIGILLLSSCQKLEGEEIEPYLGKWKCNGFIIGDHTYSPVYEVLEPYEECYLEITKGKIIFTNHGKKLKLFVDDYEFGQYHQPDGFTSEKLIVKTREIKGQKRDLIFFFKDGFLRGSFFSKNGFTETVDWKDWATAQPYVYEFHQFEKL